MADSDFDWLRDTYWYVPDPCLPALQAVNGPHPLVRTVVDQTVWYFQYAFQGYLLGISATNIGAGWNYMLIVGSVVPGGAVKLSFSPLGAGSDAPPTIGDGMLIDDAQGPAFRMQMTSGTTTSNVTHWADMRQVTGSDPQWASLPGYPDTAIPDLTGLNTPITVA